VISKQIVISKKSRTSIKITAVQVWCITLNILCSWTGIYRRITTISCTCIIGLRHLLDLMISALPLDSDDLLAISANSDDPVLLLDPGCSTWSSTSWCSYLDPALPDVPLDSALPDVPLDLTSPTWFLMTC
jgi:hypothetical protein